MVRRARRIADLSQRELAQRVGVSASTVSRIEAGSLMPSLEMMSRLVAVAELRIVVVDEQGHLVQAMEDLADTRDLAGRRFPSHLDLILDPKEGEWWGDIYGLTRPPETFARDRRWRDWQRRRSRWEVRVAQLRHVPPPRRPWTPR